MIELTPKEANATIAEMKGWYPHNHHPFYVVKESVDSVIYHTGDLQFIDHYTPCIDTIQAIHALKEWKGQDRLTRQAQIDIYSEGEDDLFTVDCDVLIKHPNTKWTDWDTIGTCTDRELSKAITTALCSAIKGEQVEIKEVE